MERTDRQLALRVSWNTILINALLCAVKLVAGIWGRSAAMLSEAAHSLCDMFNTAIALIGIKVAGRAPDRRHPYGYDRFECVAAVLLAAVLCATGLLIGLGGLRSLLAGGQPSRTPAALPALATALLPVAINEGLCRYTRAAALRTRSGALMAESQHHRSDALAALGGVVGMAGTRIGLPLLDSIACLVICTFILKAAVGIFMDAIGKMIDRACDEQTAEEIRRLALDQAQVLGLDRMQTRLFGEGIYVDLEIRADREAPLYVGHEIAHSVRDAIEGGVPQVKRCMVYVNPG